MCTAEKPDSLSALSASSGNRGFSSTSAAYGAISFSHRSRSTARNSLCSSGSLNTSNDGLPVMSDSSLLVRKLTPGPEKSVPEGSVLLQHDCPELLLKRLDPLAQMRIRCAEDAHRQQPGVARSSDRNGRPRNPGRHFD